MQAPAPLNAQTVDRARSSRRRVEVWFVRGLMLLVVYGMMLIMHGVLSQAFAVLQQQLAAR
ncbi:MAG TPA: hypothetical protein VMB34_14925 [Acetobacteraceae bacterium]|nr:hypothetical protein [Acetobacteraceae bacterium]